LTNPILDFEKVTALQRRAQEQDSPGGIWDATAWMEAWFGENFLSPLIIHSQKKSTFQKFNFVLWRHEGFFGDGLKISRKKNLQKIGPQGKAPSQEQTVVGSNQSAVFEGENKKPDYTSIVYPHMYIFLSPIPSRFNHSICKGLVMQADVAFCFMPGALHWY
jgi:hypothetical protein